MNQLLRTSLFAFIALGINSASFASDERGTIDDAVAMVKKAAVYLKANGKEKAFAEFSNPKGQFVEKDIYIFVYDKSGKNLAHGGNQRLIGKDLMDLKDTDGVFITKGLLEAAQKGGGKFNFKFLNPKTQQIEQKTSYSVMVDDVMVGSGAYTK